RRIEADLHCIPEASLVDLRDLNPAERGDRVEDVLYAHPIASRGLSVDVNTKHREATDLLGSDVLCTGHFSKDAHQCLRALTKYLEILTVELQRDVGARARDELVHPHLDGLGEAED